MNVNSPSLSTPSRARPAPSARAPQRKACGLSAFFESLPYLYFLHAAILWALFPEPLNYLLAVPMLGAGAIGLGLRLRQRCSAGADV